MTKNEICALFNCTPSQLKKQYEANAKTLAAMRDKAIKTGKKVGNATAEELTIHAERYAKLAQ